MTAATACANESSETLVSGPQLRIAGMSLHLLSDKQLAFQVSGGNSGAFGELYRRYYDCLYTVAADNLSDAGIEEPQDAVHEVFIELWRYRGRLGVLSSVESYLKQSVRYRSWTINKKFSLQQEKAAVYSDLRRSSFADPAFVNFDTEPDLCRAIQELPEDQHDIFCLHKLGGYTYARIAQVFGISVKTVEKKMTLAHKYLRRRLRDQLA